MNASHHEGPVSGESQSYPGAHRGDFSDESHIISAPLGSVSQGLLRFTSGASQVSLHVEPEMPELFRARCAGPSPQVRVNGGAVTFQYPFSWADFFRHVMTWGSHGLELTLNGSIPWQLEFGGGVSNIMGDLSQLRLGALDVSGGASQLSLRLPKPSGIVPIQIHGGVSHATFHRPVGTAARLEINGGAAWLSFDGNQLGSVGEYTRLESHAIEDRLSRYELKVSGGASHITMDTR
ncbi:hypothetical protein [Hyalangium versicolor]|uniref:hypothetical protein n=1 Tax=Hyalangium versicolor TaxID=2861190 RepID=UPI001CCF3AF6|nr:hypothetical protein [Hyalangium versicolor]